VLFAGLNTHLICGQEIPSLKFKREKGIVFFQAGAAADTICKNSGDLFYLLVPDTLKPFIEIHADNGRFISTTNDSIVRFEYLRGISYETRFIKEKTNDDTLRMKSLINGASPEPPGKLRFRIVHRQRGLLITNRFYYREPA
jgi:hypothetical protein